MFRVLREHGGAHSEEVRGGGGEPGETRFECDACQRRDGISVGCYSRPIGLVCNHRHRVTPSLGESSTRCRPSPFVASPVAPVRRITAIPVVLRYSQPMISNPRQLIDRLSRLRVDARGPSPRRARRPRARRRWSPAPRRLCWVEDEAVVGGQCIRPVIDISGPAPRTTRRARSPRPRSSRWKRFPQALTREC